MKQHLRFTFTLLIFIHCGTFIAYAQPNSILPSFTGDALLQELVANYKPNPAEVLSYNEARDVLFAYTAEQHNDSLRCVYTGYTIYLDPTADPTTDAYNKDINTEHTYPQSKGASDQPARADMHHLFPVRENANSSRGNDPYADIPDTFTDTWLYNTTVTGTMPTTPNIDAYSEHDDESQTFEPREDHKGNAARAVFYFYTMYRPEADAADTNFFFRQYETLYQWHLQDPADAWEIQRNNFIATIQDGKPNPFIIDPTRVQRAYFPDDTTGTTPPPVPNNDTITAPPITAWLSPNPAQSATPPILYYSLPDDSQINIVLYDMMGRKVRTFEQMTQESGNYLLIFDLHTNNGAVLHEGQYIVEINVLSDNDEFSRLYLDLLVIN